MLILVLLSLILFVRKNQQKINKINFLINLKSFLILKNIPFIFFNKKRKKLKQNVTSKKY